MTKTMEPSLEEMRRLATMILQTPPVICGRRVGKTLFFAEKIAEHLLRQGVILPPVKVFPSVMKVTPQRISPEDAAEIMREYKTAKNTVAEPKTITIEDITRAMDLLDRYAISAAITGQWDQDQRKGRQL